MSISEESFGTPSSFIFFLIRYKPSVENFDVVGASPMEDPVESLML